MALTYKQSQLVKSTIPALREHGERITTIFYMNMLREHPELNSYFNTVNQANGRQPRALTAVILTFASNLNHISELIPKLERMCNKHCSLGIMPEHYDIVEKYLIRAFGEVLGPIMTPQCEEAWTRAYRILANMLIGREAQMYREFGKWPGFRNFIIKKKVAETDDIFSLYLAPVDARPLPTFHPGQYISVRLDVPTKGYLQSRQYSLSEAPLPEYYRITVRRDPGMDSVKAHTIDEASPGVVSNILIADKMPGDVVEVSHPAGEFFLDISNTSSVPLILISAGVGVSPMMSILNSVIECQHLRHISWIQGYQRGIPFEEHVRRISRIRPNLRTKFFKTHLADKSLSGVTREYDFRADLGKIDVDDLQLHHCNAEYFLCGPEQFVLEMSDYLTSRNVDPSRVKTELFSTGKPR
jgi:nitric oxide dioxygenase